MSQDYLSATNRNEFKTLSRTYDVTLIVNYLCSIADFLNASDQGVEPESQIILF